MTSSKTPNSFDQANLREWLGEQSKKLGFDGLRKDYPVRREFHNYRVNCSTENKALVEWLKILGFQVQLTHPIRHRCAWKLI